MKSLNAFLFAVTAVMTALATFVTWFLLYMR